MRFAFEFRIDAVKMLVDVLLKEMLGEYRCKNVGDEEFYKEAWIKQNYLNLDYGRM